MHVNQSSPWGLLGAILTLLFHIMPLNSAAQYWQQKADYQIEVSLDDVNHELSGQIILSYTNNSPNTLDSLYFHFWPNAYNSKKSAYAKQSVRTGSLGFRFAKPEEMGKMDGFDFTINGTKAELTYQQGSKEIGILILNEPLKPSQSIEVSTPFKVKIPAVFSRMGREDSHYCITQWFPKVAKYDHEGWHAFPYLDLGEYFDDFGSYEVSITLPKKYVVAATGNLQTEQEKAWLMDRIEQTKQILNEEKTGFDQQIDNSLKTIQFKEDNVHDFAWFANPEYLVSMEVADLENGDQVESWAFYTSKEVRGWRRAPQHLSKSVKFYSKRVGNYPYETVKAVEGPLEAGGGMEYPTITVVSVPDGELERVILHEVGHNWFQGMLATDERRYPYLDEGFNSYYENRMYEEQSGDQKRRDFNTAFFEQGYFHTAIRHEDQHCHLHSDHYNGLNYGLVVYGKASMAVRFLEDYLGTALLDSCMHELFKKWRFAHPSPKDFQETFERVSQKKLDWFFTGFLGSKSQYDYSIDRLDKTGIQISNKGNIAAPFQLSFKGENGAVISQEWLSGVTSDTIVAVPTGTKAVLINDGVYRFETETKNNYYFLDQLAKKYDKIKLKFVNPIDDPVNRELVLAPALGYNTNDGNLLGLAVYNPIFPQRRFEYQLATMIGFESRMITWLGNMGRNWFWQTEKYKKQFQLGLQSRSFSQGYFTRLDDEILEKDFRHMKFQPYARLLLKPKPYNHRKLHELSARVATRNLLDTGTDTESWTSIGEINYTYSNREVVFDRSLKLSGRGNDEFLRLSSEFKASIPYSKKSKFYLRAFGGAFILQPENGFYNFRMTNLAGFFDYMLDDLAFDRSLDNNFLQRQLSTSDGGITTPNRAFSSNKSLIALNLAADVPIIPIRAMMNAAVIPGDDNPFANGQSMLTYEAGLQVAIYKDIVTINLPFIYSRDFRNGQDGFLDLNSQSFWDNITFTLQLSKLNPFKIAENYSILQ